MLARLVTACVVVGLVAGCSSDEPSREDAVEVLEDRCDTQVGALARLDRPKDVFQLSDVGRDAFSSMSGTLGDLDAAGLQKMEDDRPVQRYLRAAAAAKKAMGDVGRMSGLEDVPGLRRSISEGESAGEDLDDAADALELPDRCGSRAWGGSLLTRAEVVADAEVDAMRPTGDLADDVGTYCGRYRRSIRGATDQGDLEADRAWAFAVRHGVTLFAERLERLDPSAAQQGAFDALTGAVRDTASTLAPAETYAVDGQEQRLQDLVDDAEAGLRRIDALVLSLGADC